MHLYVNLCYCDNNQSETFTRNIQSQIQFSNEYSTYKQYEFNIIT